MLSQANVHCPHFSSLLVLPDSSFKTQPSQFITLISPAFNRADESLRSTRRLGSIWQIEKLTSRI